MSGTEEEPGATADPDQGAGSAAERNRTDDAYRGVPGAFPYAFRASESRLFRSYVVAGGLLAAGVTVLFALALVVLVADTLGTAGGVFTFSRSFFVLVGFLVVAPLIAPVLFAARRHRREGSTRGYDFRLAAAGYLFVAAVYVGLVISTPAEQQASTSGAVGAVVDALYALPRPAGIVPPLLVAVAILVLGRRTRESAE